MRERERERHVFSFICFLHCLGHMLNDGDIVDIFFNGNIVGHGTIFNVDGSGLCQGVQIGSSCVSVSIDSCYNVDLKLPFLTMDTCKLGEAVESTIRW